MLTLIAAVAKDGAIGRQGQLLWHIPDDLKHFKAVTMGAPVIMGRATWESLPFRPLPGRLNIVISRQSDYHPVNAKGEDVSDRVMVLSNLDDAIDAAEAEAERLGKEAFVIGGGHIYAATIDRASAIELTEIDASVEDADTHFPTIDPEEWHLTKQESPLQSENTPPFRFVRYERR
ncbi:MAG: dihydrofolate reductase [Muribaculaceae bacterium]|nr:dihydrofolate reductase [Muribaculaceae bacterium]